jgi:RHS repeat-associated protein
MLIPWRARKTPAAATAVVFAAAVTTVAVVIAPPASAVSPPAPVQQAGTAAGLPHRVAASATSATLSDDVVVTGGSAQGQPGKQVAPPPGAVPAATSPPRVTLGSAASQPRDQVKVLPHSAVPTPAVQGFDPRTSRVITPAAAAHPVVYQNADGTRTAQFPAGQATDATTTAQVSTAAGPSAGEYGTNGTTFVQSPFRADNSSSGEIDVGTYDGGANVARGLLSFGEVSSALRNDAVLGVRLGLFETWSWSCSAEPVDVYPITSSWSVPGLKTYPGPSIGALVGESSFAAGESSSCPAAWVGIPLSQAGIQLVNGWTHGTAPDDGLALGASASQDDGWKKFASNHSSGNPFLAITYSPNGASYALAAQQPVVQVTPTQNGALAVRVTNTGASTWTPANGYELSYEAYNAAGALVADHPVFTAMPSSVPPGATVTVDAKVNALPIGTYAINFSMYSGATTSAPASFLAQGIAPLPVELTVPQPPPVVSAVNPPTGYDSATVNPELSATASSPAGTPVTYQFQLTCQPLPGTTCPDPTQSSGPQSAPYWLPQSLTWGEPYTWTVTATTNGASVTIGPMAITAEVPQPAITSLLGDSSGQAFDPQSGNFTTSATDAAVAVAGPPLEIQRTYNSLDPRTTGAFGAGWASSLDTAVIPDADATGNVVVALPDGQQLRFGYEASAGTYAPPAGSPDALVKNQDGTWTLTDSTGYRYGFTGGGTLEAITSPAGLTQTLASNAGGEVTTVADTASGRALHLTWSTPAGAAHPHVASVTTSPAAAGKAGLTWTYSYQGDRLAKVCGATGGCTSYSYGTGSDYRSAVLDSGPGSYWQLGDPAGSVTAADSVDANLGTTDGSYSNVTLGLPGPLADSAATTAGFNGTTSSVSLPAGLIANQDYVTIGLWFKAASKTASGVLLGYQADPLTDPDGGSGADDPALYVGGNGDLYGELWNGSVDPMRSTASVDDGAWHYAVLTGSATSQSLWLDGTMIATRSGQITPDGMTADTVGAGFWGDWPSDYTNQGPARQSPPIGYFSGSIGQVAVYPHPLGQPAIAGQYALATSPTAELTRVALPSGETSEQASYDPGYDRVDGYTDPNGGQWQIGAPVTTGNAVTTTSPGTATRSVTVVTPAGYDEAYGYDALNGGRLVRFTPGAGDAPETFGYDKAGYLNRVQNSDGNVITLYNDAHGNVLSRTWYPPKPANPPSTGSCVATGAPCTTYYRYYYDTANPLDPRNDELVGVADARSASASDTTYLTTYAFNPLGELTSSTTPATGDFPSGRTTTYQYSTASTAAYGGAGAIPAGLLLSSQTPGKAVTSYAYYPDGDLAQVTQPGGARTVYTYDGLGRSLTATTYSDTNPGGLTTSDTYNADNQPLSVTYPGTANKVTGVTHTLRDTYGYDSDGSLTSLTQSDLTGGDPARTTRYAYNDRAEVASVTQPAGATTSYTYNNSGQVATTVDPDGNQYGYSYNEYDEVTQVTLQAPAPAAPPPSPSAPPSSGAPAPCAAGQVPGQAANCVLALDSYAYDPAGLLATATDAMGRSTSYFYNSDQELIASRQLAANGTGRQTTDGYDAAGNLTQTDASGVPVSAANQTVTDYAYDAADRVTNAVSDPVPAGASNSGYTDRTISYTYNADNLVTSQTVAGAGGSSATDYAYNGADELISQAVVNGTASDTTTWAYDQLGQQVSMTAPDGNAAGAASADYTTSYAYDQTGNLAQVTGPPVAVRSYAAQAAVTARPVTTYGYDTFGDQTQARDPDGNVTSTAYDRDGQTTAVTQPSYTPPGAKTAITAATAYTYDGNGNLTSVTDPEHNATTYGYDPLGDVTTQTDPRLAGESAPGGWTFTYDTDGEQLSATTPTGARTQATYDAFGDQLTATQDIRTSSGTQANTTSYTYDYLGDPLTVTTPDDAITTNTYDHLGELTSTANAYGDSSGYAYDYAGQPLRITNPDGTADDYGYDPAGDLTSATVYGLPAASGQPPPVLAATSYAYDRSGNQVSATDPDKVTTAYAYNAADQLTSQVQPVSATASDSTSYGYDLAGNQTFVTGGRGNTTWTSYNTWNLPESVIEPATATATTAAARTWTTGYNADGLPATVTEPGGITQTYGYDQLGDLTSETGTGAAAATTAQAFGYDPDGNMTSATAPGGTDTFTYNDDGELTATSGPSGTGSFGYNADGLMTSRADAAGTTSYTYDHADRLATVADPLTGATLAYGYDADSQPASIGYAEGGDAGPAQALRYNGLQQLASDTLTSAKGATIASASYHYDPDGNLTSQATAGYAGAGAVSYGYNEADELTSATAGGTTTSFGYDADGDLTSDGSTTFAYNAQDQLADSTSPAGTTAYGYTQAGVLSSVAPPAGGAQRYTSNAYGQTVTAPGGISYAYDALGRLTSRTAGSDTADFAYSGAGDTVADADGTRYSYDPAGDPVAAREGDAAAGAALTDAHGDLTGLFSPSAATTSTSASAAYSPYGTVTATAGTMPSLGYQDQYTDPRTGDTDMSARWYSPATGTFTSNDTVTGMPEPQGASPTPYGYAQGDPLTGTDPSGHGFCFNSWWELVLCFSGSPAEDIVTCALECPWPSPMPPYQNMPYVTPLPGGHSAPSQQRPPGGSGGGCGAPCVIAPIVIVPIVIIALPPPQDCYADPDPSCVIPNPPGWFRQIYEPGQPHNVTNPKFVPPNDRVDDNPGLPEIPVGTGGETTDQPGPADTGCPGGGGPAPPGAPAPANPTGPGNPTGPASPTNPVPPEPTVPAPGAPPTTAPGPAPAPSPGQQSAQPCGLLPSVVQQEAACLGGQPYQPNPNYWQLARVVVNSKNYQIATGANACLLPGFTEGKSKARVNLPGYEKGQNLNRGHLIAAVLGGSNTAAGNFVPLYWPTNRRMESLELRIKSAVNGPNGQIVWYVVIPDFKPSTLVPYGITLYARGSHGYSLPPEFLANNP